MTDASQGLSPQAIAGGRYPWKHVYPIPTLIRVAEPLCTRLLRPLPGSLGGVSDPGVSRAARASTPGYPL